MLQLLQVFPRHSFQTPAAQPVARPECDHRAPPRRGMRGVRSGPWWVAALALAGERCLRMKYAITLATPSTSQSSIASPADKWILESQQATICRARQTPTRMNIALTRNFTALSMNFAIYTVISLGSPFTELPTLEDDMSRRGLTGKKRKIAE